MLWRDATGCGVTANMPALGAVDSGFESRHPDKRQIYLASGGVSKASACFAPG
jgi:hypothetical protein